MKSLAFFRLLQPAVPGSLMLLPEVAGPARLHLSAADGLVVHPAQYAGDGACAAELFAHGAAWYLIPRHPGLQIDGLTPLGLVALQPGQLLTLGSVSWLITTQWQPQCEPTPAEVADKSCPVCGMPLQLAPTIECICGRRYHLEKPDGRGQ